MHPNVKEHEKHFDIERRIDLYINGKLNQPQIDNLWVDLIENPSHFNYLKTTATLKSVLDKDGKSHVDASIIQPAEIESPTNVRPLFLDWKKYAVAAAIVLISGVTATYYMGTATETTFDMPLDSLELVVYRSTDTTDLDVNETKLQEAVDLALAGNYTSAIILLNNLIEQNTDASTQAEALLNIGIIEYNNDDFNAALIALERASTFENIDKLLYERIMWNLSHTHMALGNQLAAKQSIQTVIDLDGAHSRMAQNYIKYLK